MGDRCAVVRVLFEGSLEEPVFHICGPMRRVDFLAVAQVCGDSGALSSDDKDGCSGLGP